LVEVQNILRPKSLFTTLIVVVCLLAGLAIFGAVSGWQLLLNVSDSQQQLSKRNLPLISAAHSMATQSAALALLAAQISNVDGLVKLEIIYRQIERHLKLMEVIPRRLEQLEGKNSTHADIEYVVGEIKGLFLSIHHVVLRKLDSATHRVNVKLELNQSIERIRELVEVAIADKSDAFFAESEQLFEDTDRDHDRDLEIADQLLRLNLDSQLLFDFNQRATELAGLIDKLASVSAEKQLRDIKSRIDFQLRLMVGSSTEMSRTQIGRPLGIELNFLFKMLNDGDNISSLQRQHLSIKLELTEIDNALQEAVHELNALTKALVTQVDIDTRENSESANAAAELGTNILLAIAILSLVVSVVAIWFFVIQKMILPLKELATLMHEISNNKLDVEIRRYSMVELNEIALALEVFKDNTQALDDHQKDLQESNFLLSRVNEDLNTFVRVASHDLKSPLRGIRLLSEFISDDIKSGGSEDVQANLELMQKRISRLDGLLDALLGYTQADMPAGKAKSVDIGRVIRDTFELVVANRKFELQLKQQLPSCKLIESDLTIILLNLFDNAISHHDLDSGKLDVNFSENENSYIFEVSDDGPGIELKYHQMIFEILKTLQSKDVVEGSGVGLAHVKRLLESRGGKIAVVSNPDASRGSRFVFHYPKQAVAA
jgi:signal transduction histidine kinase